MARRNRNASRGKRVFKGTRKPLDIPRGSTRFEDWLLSNARWW
jgi:hypothetical protein